MFQLLLLITDHSKCNGKGNSPFTMVTESMGQEFQKVIAGSACLCFVFQTQVGRLGVWGWPQAGGWNRPKVLH